MTHQITVCTSCRYKKTDEKPGAALIEHLRRALIEAGDEIPEPFDVWGCPHGRV